jgi:Zn finger protein HypA/HybF involved in hydrogenase expression
MTQWYCENCHSKVALKADGMKFHCPRCGLDSDSADINQPKQRLVDGMEFDLGEVALE